MTLCDPPARHARPEWRDRLDDVLEQHIGSALDLFDIEYKDLPDLIGQYWPSVLWRCALEDMLTRSFGPEQAAGSPLQGLGAEPLAFRTVSVNAS